MLKNIVMCLLVVSASAFVGRSGPQQISRTRSFSSSTVTMLFRREPKDPWEAMKARGQKELNSQNLNDVRDDPYDKRNVGVGMRSARYRSTAGEGWGPQPGEVKNKRGPNVSRKAVSQRQVSRAAARPGVSVAAGMGSSKVRDEKALYKTTNKVNKFGNKSAGNLGQRDFVDISDQDEAGFLPDFVANFFYDKSVGGPQRDLESVIAVQLFFATFVIVPTGLYLGGYLNF